MRRGFRSQAAPPRGLVPCPQSDLEKQGRISRKSEGLSLPLAGSGRAKDFRNYGRVDGAVQRCGRLGPPLLVGAGAAVPAERGPAEGVALLEAPAAPSGPSLPSWWLVL